MTRASPLPRTVWALGLVSLFMDISSEMIHALLPLFLTTTLGASVAMVGLIDGIGEATASIAKVFSGYVSDRVGKRKPLILIGYGLGAASKPLFALAGAPGPVLAARFIDRVGKGLRGAPRDALVADVTQPEQRGRAFGLRQSLDTVGAFIGPLLAIGLLWLYAGQMRPVFMWAIVPGAIAVLLVFAGVEDAADPAEPIKPRPFPLRRDMVRMMPPQYWTVVAIGVVFTLARFSEGFLVLRLAANGLPLAYAPLVLVAMNVVYSAAAYPVGALSDRVGIGRLLVGAMLALVAADLTLAFATSVGEGFVGVALWGLHMAMSQGLLAQLVAKTAPADLRGSGFGLFNLACGAAMLAASLLAGILWDSSGAMATFVGGAGLAALSVVLLVATRYRLSA